MTDEAAENIQISLPFPNYIPKYVLIPGRPPIVVPLPTIGPGASDFVVEGPIERKDRVPPFLFFEARDIEYTIDSITGRIEWKFRRARFKTALVRLAEIG